MKNNYPDHGCLLQHTPGENHFATSFCLYFGSHQTVEQRWDPEDPAYNQPQPKLPAISSPTHSTTTAPVPTTGNRWRYPIRPYSFSRWRERARGRYLLRHVPYFMHCPLPHCAWRGNSAELFNSHWQQEDHRGYHAYYGRTPKRSQIETYDPWIILNQIQDGAISIREGEIRASILVLVKAFVLQKAKVWWGRSRKKHFR